VDSEALEERIAAFLEWNYLFKFDNGVSTPLFDATMINRQQQRREYLFDPLKRLLGGTLRGARVLDLGCGAGFWSLQAIDAGADYVLGIDAKQTPLAQAKLVFEGKGVADARYDFEQRDIFDCDPPGRFDVILCLGVIGQIARPVELFELFARVGAEIILIETDIARGGSSSFQLSTIPAGRTAVDRRIVLIPTRAAIGALASDFGYASVALAREMSDYTGLDDYRRGTRLAFLCSNGRSLEGLAAEKPPATRWWAPALEIAQEGVQRLRS
jgi:SAM-dependent methyltransferase